MLAWDFLTHQVRADRSGGSPLCRTCPENSPKNEDLNHILTECLAYKEVRQRMFPEISEVCKMTKSECSFEDILRHNSSLCQFLLDRTSFNLENQVHIDDPALPALFRMSPDYCYAINSIRMKKLSANNVDKN